jgi:hypothetical protein
MWAEPEEQLELMEVDLAERKFRAVLKDLNIIREGVRSNQKGMQQLRGCVR